MSVVSEVKFCDLCLGEVHPPLKVFGTIVTFLATAKVLKVIRVVKVEGESRCIVAMLL
jgi:hypothetical protein